MLKIRSIDKSPCHYLPHFSSQPRGRAAARRLLPFYRGRAVLPAGLSCVVLASDLQGRESIGGRLLGEAVAEVIREGAATGTWPRPDRIFLCGDLFDTPDCDKRGASGPVDTVWQAFAYITNQVTGVHGNHDWLDQRLPHHTRVLDGDVEVSGDFSIGGVSGIVGKPTKNQRKTQADYMAALTQVLDQAPHLVLLHQGPDGPGRRGDPEIRALLEAGHTGLTVFGHCHWPDDDETGWLIPLGEGQAVNVDGRVVILEASDV